MRLPARKRLCSDWKLSSSVGKLMSAAQAADCACGLIVMPPDAEEEERFVINLSPAPKSFWLCLVLLSILGSELGGGGIESEMKEPYFLAGP